jgi:ABC-type antimicrobial peptide transport system permease subunit
VIVNEAFVAKYLPPGNPLGQTIHFVGEEGQPMGTIVGVARNTPLASLKDDVEPIVFGSYAQHLMGIRGMTFLMRGAGSADLAGSARRVLETLDSRRPVTNVRTLDAQIDRSLGQERLFAILCSAFAALGLLIAAVGLYGTLAYGVSRRTSEIGVRIALGARRSRVVALIVRESLAMIFAGIAVGLPAIWWSEKLIGSFLFKTAPNDPRALVLPVAVLTVSALIAAGIPAWRAARIDPVQALRHD